jgi:hypothetical protein
MIIQIESATSQNTAMAKHQLEALTHGWGHELTAAAAPASGDTDAIRRGIDPVALATLVLSIPSAALAVLDLADRIHKRRRARELIDHAQQLKAQQVTTTLVSHRRAIELSSLTPDQLLDLLADEDQASTPPS